MAYQFFHIEAYSLQAKSYEREITIKKRSQGRREKTKKTETRSIKEIMEEQARIDEACPHVDEPRRPGLLYGVPLWRFYLSQRNGQTRRKMPGATKLKRWQCGSCGCCFSSS